MSALNLELLDTLGPQDGIQGTSCPGEKHVEVPQKEVESWCHGPKDTGLGSTDQEPGTELSSTRGAMLWGPERMQRGSGRPRAFR